jgi:hypothetical protein
VAQCSCSAALQKWQQGSVGPHVNSLLQQPLQRLLLFPTHILTLKLSQDFLFSILLRLPSGTSASALRALLRFSCAHIKFPPPSVPKAAAFSLAIRHSLHLVRLLSTQPLQTDQVSLLPLRKREYFLDSGFHCCQVNQGKCNLSRSLSASNCNSNSSFDNSRSQWI